MACTKKKDPNYFTPVLTFIACASFVALYISLVMMDSTVKAEGNKTNCYDRYGNIIDGLTCTETIRVPDIYYNSLGNNIYFVSVITLVLSLYGLYMIYKNQ